jgi:hypothetical protein
VFARAAHDQLILGHGRSLADAGHFEQVFVRADARAGRPGQAR